FHSPVGEKLIFWARPFSFGTAIHLNFDAPSDQNETLRSYGMRLSLGVNVRTSLNAPVWESNFGIGPLASEGIWSQGFDCGREGRPYGDSVFGAGLAQRGQVTTSGTMALHAHQIAFATSRNLHISPSINENRDGSTSCKSNA